ncbi:hypothetical protein [Legionella waltersii]|uniref:Uncharacterized protein n=1 Tax=Legionella waltersii TaxID=66969 RepID=A0A0W1AMG1_9GAMM|nr:hypothetical protein [Legionella waltersii]KTD82555.1 hypothetical protein Lwal_0593 [Legionella waltersii]SNU95163.1 Aerobic respiration control sensor protein ArcB [Legionella waltersii]
MSIVGNIIQYGFSLSLVVNAALFIPQIISLITCATHEMLKKLLILMTQELPTDLECMKKAFKALDYPLVEKTTHKSKVGLSM